MFDTMTFTKIIGGFCGALLVFLLGSWVAESLYHGGGGHGEKHAEGYAIEVEDAGASGGMAAAADDGPDFAELYAMADASKGEKVFGKCKACHKLEDGANGTGPHLWNVVDRQVSVVEGYRYSGALVKVAQVWSPENLDGFLKKPKTYAPGTKMGFAGLKKPQDRANLIAYLATIK